MIAQENDLATAMINQQDRLIRLCASITGDWTLAEDLAAQTLTEAWQMRNKLYDMEGLAPWLSAIARNMCRRWLRKHRDRTWTRLVEEQIEHQKDWLSDDLDLETEFERHELTQLLEQALGLLPAETRQILIDQQVYDLSYAEIASRMGIGVDAVAMRLSRGKARLRKVLTTELADRLMDYDFFDPETTSWESTRIWCPICGTRHLEGRVQRPDGYISFRCPQCSTYGGENHADSSLANRHFANMLRDVKRYKTAWNRVNAWTHDYFTPGLAQGQVACTHCGQMTELQHGETEKHRLFVTCLACSETCSASLGGFVLALPVVRQFWQDHNRIRCLSPREVEIDGRQAYLTKIEALSHSATLELITAIDNLDVINSC